MQLSFTQKKHIRKNFGKLVEGLSIPNLIEVQKNSYNEFLESKSLKEQLNELSKGIDKVFYYYEFEHFEIATIKNDWIQSYHHTGFDKEKGSVLIFNQGIKQHEIKDKMVHELWQ